MQDTDINPMPDITQFDTIRSPFAALLSYAHVETAGGAGVSTVTGDERDAVLLQDGRLMELLHLVSHRDVCRGEGGVGRSQVTPGPSFIFLIRSEALERVEGGQGIKWRLSFPSSIGGEGAGLCEQMGPRRQSVPPWREEV